MAPQSSTIEIDRPPGEVFAVAADPTRFREWQPDVIRVDMLDAERFATVRRFVGAQHTTLQRITANEPPRFFAAEGVDGMIRPHAMFTIEPLDGGARSRVTFTLDFEGVGAGAAILPLVRRTAAKRAAVSYQHLKALLEGTA
ncbi:MULTISPECIES: SRPBCC family protein [Glycomyces]|uniref:SRPBCC family protein n=2 Tax=Glycomyces TaxID=58113 RepID=A0A9X3PKS8_9ACTN|nr:SRPBCC family protein [Glycomyces lechevalierae]MDA1387219.1 SRPBCC family protein [Glycomyces lechevalierae]MDR7338517.1 uncharacterized protein YndB with AHSA1/START domain [Glycomyces lechevalierae]